MRPSLDPRRLSVARLAAWAGLWTALGLTFATQLYMAESRFATSPTTWLDALRSELPDWYLWGLLALVVRWLSRRFRIDRESWERTVPIHFGASLSLGLVHVALSTAVQGWLRGGAAAPFLPRLVDAFTVSYHWNLIIYWAIAALLHARAYAKDAQETRVRAAELEAEFARARLQALTLQLRPHFLFNSLNTIAELVHEDPDAADRMLSRLSELLRWTLDSADSPEIPLERELDLVGRYIDIERARFPDRLTVEIEVAHDALAALVPAMILLPLVENAIQHGVAGRGRGSVGVRAGREHGALHLEVWDDGAGSPPSAPGRRGGRGIGLANTRARLEHLYGAAHRLELGRTERGSVVRLTVPFRAA